MNVAREYRAPLLIGAGTLVVALLVWVALIAPQNSKLTSLQAQQTQLQTQETTLQAKLATLRTEQQKLSTSCADLQKITTQIPSVQSPTDVDAEESSFESQFNGLDVQFGGLPDPVQRVRPGNVHSRRCAAISHPDPEYRWGVRQCRPRWRSPATMGR